MRTLDDVTLNPAASALNPIASAFNRAAHSYAPHSQLQQRVGDDLLRLMSPIASAARILEVGCGSGEFTQKLCVQWPQAEITAIDQAPAMVARATDNLKSYASITVRCQDMQLINEVSAFDAPFDLVAANFVLQWATDVSQVIPVLWRALQPQGYLCFSVPVQGSLFELQQAWLPLREQAPIHPLQSVEQWVNAITPYFHIQQLQHSTYVEHRHQLRDLLRLFKQWGANALPHRRNGLMGKNKWQALQNAYQTFYGEQGFPMTFQVLTVCAKSAA